MQSPAPPIDVQALMRGLVHELRNPLSAILTAASLLKSGDDLDEESAMLLGVVDKESRRMNRILTEFASFVKPPATRPEALDLALMLRSLLREMQGDGSLAQCVEVRDDLPAHLRVFCDPIQTRQAFQHLLCNAAQAMEKGGALRLHLEDLSHLEADGETAPDAPTATVLIDDEGVGFSENAVQHALQPFFSTKPSATGLGLSIAGGLIRASGGEISIHNRLPSPHIAPTAGAVAGAVGEPRGARVRVRLPRSVGEADDHVA